MLTHQEWTERNKKKAGDDSKFKRNRGGSRASRGRGRGRGKGNNQVGRGGRERSGSHNRKDENRALSSNQDKSGVQCYNSQDYRHFTTECKNHRRERIQENNLIQDDEPALMLASLETREETCEVFLNEEKVNPQL